MAVPSLVSRGAVNLADIRGTFSNTRSTFTQVRSRREETDSDTKKLDFITLVALICDIYGQFGDDLIPVQQFHPDAERQEDSGHTCIVSQRAISVKAASNVTRGESDALAEDIVVKRTRESVLHPGSSGLHSLVNELRIRTHHPIRNHPNIARFRGIAWDFENVEATQPRPLLLEELAPQRSMARFWRDYDFLRMNFMAKMELCLDIAIGLAALHGCDVAHGDVKPDNVLIFPRVGRQEAFMAKLTDFGHSVSAHQGLTSMPAHTPQWCAPEVLDYNHRLDFSGMKATDVYSFGLVVLSTILGRPYYQDLDTFEVSKRDGSMFDKAILMIEKEDQECQDSDFEMDIIQQLLSNTLLMKPAERSLEKCISILQRYKSTLDNSGDFFTMRQQTHSLDPLVALDVDQAAISMDDKDARQAAAAWELVICHFSGFGTPRDFASASHLLHFAIERGIPAAKAFSIQLHQSMHIGIGMEDQDMLHQAPAGVFEGFFPSKPMGDDSVLLTAISGPGKIEPSSNIYIPSQNRDGQLMATSKTSQVSASETMVTSIKRQDDESLSKLLASDPASANHQDRDGATPLIVAARSGCYRSMELLLKLPSIDAGISNNYQEQAMHFLNNFTDSEIRLLVPQLLNKNGDPYHEALPLQHKGSFLDLSTKIRCCSVLRAVLSGNLVLLSCLLEETHKAKNDMRCRICESGSRFRRIVAIALSTFRFETLNLILDHLKTHKPEMDISFRDLKTWTNRELLPLWQLPFQSVVVKTIDLPESFYRAISFGSKCNTALFSTLNFLLDEVLVESDQLELLYKMLIKATATDNISAVNFILNRAEKRGFSPSWWVKRSSTNLSKSPLLLAIKFGFRSVFDCLWDSNRIMLANLIEVDHEESLSPIAKMFSKRPETYKKVRLVNFVQICLSSAVTAAHQDPYFFTFILDHADRKYIVQQPELFEKKPIGGFQKPGNIEFPYSGVKTESVKAKRPCP
ncbi:serine threonine kinase [Fusarium pseudoanthophilum]|uniref:Serine threonine kinase n=1 Tax=Fusarium pseudoanthophilum TaxID=48495 RepID=A0A8H5KY94_9HYPO|nr:serine threonine kinase [Fusarium pseudoanthophilum]